MSSPAALIILTQAQVEPQILTVTDGLVSIRARVTAKARDDFQTRYSSLLSSVETKTITCTISGITHTHLTHVARRIQLLLSSLTISSAPCNNDSQVMPIHEVDQIKTFLDGLQQLHLPDNTVTPVEVAVPPSASSADTDVGLTETLSDHVEVVERSTPLKRPHSQSSPSQSGSHRLVRRRLHNDDEDVIVQTGLNLYQPVQLHQRLLSVLSNRGQSVRTSTAADREQALRLVSAMPAQMAPPPIPAIRDSDFHAQAPSQVVSQDCSQGFQSQIPMVKVPAPGPTESGACLEDNAAMQFERKQSTLPRITIPSNTPTSAQPEPLEVTPSSLPRASSQRVPLLSQSEPVAASLATSSSHLLDQTSSCFSKPMHRAPSELFIKYARRPIPKSQRSLLEKPASWWPARPGHKFPHPNIPVEDLNKIEKAAERQAAKVAENERAKQIEEGSEQERQARMSNTLLVTQGTQDSVLSWSSSPEYHTEPRHRNDTLRRSTNIVEPEPPDRLPLLRLLPGEYPPDSSADHMQIDEPEEGKQVVRIPSSPPPDYSSGESYNSDADDDAPPESNARQLPEYPLSSPEEISPELDLETRSSATQLQPSHLGRNPYNGSRPKILDLTSSPVLEVAASPQLHETVETPAMNSSVGEHDILSVQQDLSHSGDAPLTHGQDQADDNVFMDDQAQVKNIRVVEKQSENIVTDITASGPRKHRKSDWGLTNSTETILQRQARMKREFFARPKKVLVHETDTSNSSVPQTTVQPDDEAKDLELPAANTGSQPDLLDVNETPVKLAKPLDPDAVSRVAIVDQWYRQSDQGNDHPITAPGTRPLRHAVSDPVILEPMVSGPTVSESTASELPVPDAARSVGSLPPRSLPADRAGLDTSSVNSLPPRPSNRADTHMRNSGSRIRKEIKRGRFGEPTRALWVGSLPGSITNAQLEQIFAEFSPVSASAKMNFGFVNFADVDAACRALEARHNFLLDRQRIVCKFTTARGPAPSNYARSSLTIDDLLRQLVNKRGFKGNRTAFETLCKNLHTSSDIPPPQWDNYVVFQPADFLPWASRTIANGGKILDYDTYWREHLQHTAEPDLDPLITPAKLNIVFGRAPVSKVSSNRFSAPVSPQMGPVARQPPSPSVHRTPVPVPSLAPRVVADDLRRSVVESNASSATSTPQKVISKRSQPLSNLPEPLRTSKWLRLNFQKDPNGRVIQRELYKMYKDEFVGSSVPPIAGGLFVGHVFNTYPGQTVSELDGNGNKTFYCTGLRHKFPPRPPPADGGSPEFRIKGVSTSTPTVNRNSDGNPDESRSHPRDRDSRPPRRSLPFRDEQRYSRSRSPLRNPPPRAPRGKLYPPDHLLTDEVSIFSF